MEQIITINKPATRPAMSEIAREMLFVLSKLCIKTDSNNNPPGFKNLVNAAFAFSQVK